MPLIDSHLVLPVIPRESLTLEFETNIAVSRGDSEHRMPKRGEPRYSFKLDTLTLCKSELDTFKNFYKLCQGSYHTFWYKSSIEYKCTHVGDFYEFEDSTETEADIYVSSYGKLYYNGITGNWQAAKVWQMQRFSNIGGLDKLVTTHKTIRYLNPDTLRVFVDNVESFDFELFPLGIISFPGTSYTGSEDIRFEGEYSTEVRFSDAEIAIDQLSDEYYQLANIELKEQPNNGIGGYAVQDFENAIGFHLNLPFKPRIEDRLVSSMYAQALDNGREIRETTSSTLSRISTIESTVLHEREKNYVVTFFLCCKGRLLEFSTNKSVLSRFDTDSLTITLETLTDCPKFTLSDLSLRCVEYAFEPDDCVGLLNAPQSTLLYQSVLDFGILARRVSTDYLQDDIEGVSGSLAAISGSNWLQGYADRMQPPKAAHLVINISLVRAAYSYFDETPGAIEAAVADLNSNFVPGSRLNLLINDPLPSPLVNVYYTKLQDIVEGLNGYPVLDKQVRDSITIHRSFPHYTLVRGETYIQLLAKGGVDKILTLAFCLRLEVSPTEVYGFTSLDSDIPIEGIIYKSYGAIEPSSTSSEINLGTDNLEIKSLISNESITAQRLVSGYFDNAKVAFAIADFITHPATFNESQVLLKGRVGKITLTNSIFTIELRSLSERLNKSLSRKTSPICHYSFGDPKCQLDLIAENLKYENVPIDAIGTNALTLGNGVNISNSFINGVVTVKTGLNAGITLAIESVVSLNSIEIRGELAGAFETGDLLDISAFCQKDQFACKAYGNFFNFGGIPVGGGFMPGLDKITVVP